MDFNIFLKEAIVSFILLFRSLIGFIFSPYKTMRKISLQKELGQVWWIYIICILFFLNTGIVRSGYRGLMGALFLYGVSILFFSLLPSSDTYKERLTRMWITWTHTLIPTCIWFYCNLLLFIILPPPRSITFLGASFSIFYIAFSVSLLVWKLILVYLSLRFALRIHIYRIFYYMLLYIALSAPLWVFLYNMGISRIPFV